MERDIHRRAPHMALSRIGEDPGVANALAAILEKLEDITNALTPIIGQHGVSALYKRSLFLSAARHSSLADVPGKTVSLDNGLDLTPLRTALQLQDVATVESCGKDLLQTLNHLLTSLIGTSLTERLLLSVWEDSLCGSPPQDNLL